MKKLNLIVILIVFAFISNNLFAQDMKPPDPIKSPLLDAMMGTWVSEPYEFMGSMNTDEVDHKMILNGQFMEVDVTSKSDKGFTYEGLGIIAPSTDGTMTGWFYDMFGKNNITTYSGTVSGNKVNLVGTSNMGTETREIILDGNTMIHNVSFTMKDQSGKEMQQKITITYKKKN